MSEWIDMLSAWSGIDHDALIILLVFVLVVVLIVVGFISVALVLVFRPSRTGEADRKRQSKPRGN